MKKTTYLTSLILMFMALHSFGQCFVDRHDSSDHSSWESCSPSSNPNPARGTGHWIMYDLGSTYALGQFHFWNYNYPGETNKGMQNIIIDYGINTSSWQGGINHTVSEAIASSFYEGEVGPQLNGAEARYVLITIEENYGGDCFGFSEMRIGIYEDPCDQLTLNKHEIPVLSGLYHAEQVLNAEGLINATSDVLFQSENEINLDPGFESKQGAVFEARIEDCPNGN